MKIFPYICDPSHGWLRVSRHELNLVGFDPEDFSRYSYRSRVSAHYYLEEDCDMKRFLDVWHAMYGDYELNEQFSNSDSHIRQLPRIHD